MSKKNIILILVILVVIVAGFFIITEVREEPLIEEEAVSESEEAVRIAKEWVTEKSPTYLFDGENLELLTVDEIEDGMMYRVYLSFTSRMAGYGDRTDEPVAQVVTSHIIDIVVEEGEVVKAITDEYYDEKADEIIDLGTKVIYLYFLEVVDGQEEIVEVTREIPLTIAPARTAIEELLKGPLSDELSTSIKEGTELLGINLADGVVTVDFSKELDEGVAGSAWVTSIRNKIERTLLQFEEIEEVIIWVEGSNDEILQP